MHADNKITLGTYAHFLPSMENQVLLRGRSLWLLLGLLLRLRGLGLIAPTAAYAVAVVRLRGKLFRRQYPDPQCGDPCLFLGSKEAIYV